MRPQTASLLQIHAAVLLFALSGLFAKWLTLAAIIIVFARASVAAVTLALYLPLRRQTIQWPSRRQMTLLATTGLLLALHWTTFFAAIQWSSVAIGLLTFASFPLWVSVLEPWWFNEPFQRSTIVQAAITVLGIYLIVPLHQVSDNDFVGAMMGIVSALTFAILTLMNRQFRQSLRSEQLAMWQNGFAALCLLPLLWWQPVSLTTYELLLLLLLGIVFTAFAHSLFIQSLSHIKAHTASLVVALEPVYGVLAAAVLLDEPLTLAIFIGGSLIIAVNLWASRQSAM